MDDAERRAILREHGEEPPAKGKLGPDWVTRADALRADAPPPEGDYDGGVTEADFDVTTAGEPPVLPPERKPRRITTRKTLTPLQRISRMRSQDKAKAKARAKKHPRLSIAPLVGEIWGVMGSLATRVDVPLGRCLQMQSPVAGEILEDVVKGTMVDAALQPIARAEDKAKAVAALVLPPALVLAIEQAQALPEDQRQMREAFLWPMLVQSMMLWERVAGDKVEAMAERATAEAPSRERAEQMARLIFAVTVPEQSAPEPETVGV